MVHLQPFYGAEYLSHLVRFGLSFVILDIDPWITLPRHLVYSMAAATLTGFAKEEIAHLTQIGEPNILGICPHSCQNIFNLGHA
jgi:hypothetical protein